METAGEPPTIDEVYAAYGRAMLRAQFLESDLEMVVSLLEAMGAMNLESERKDGRVKEYKNGIIEACIGPMIYWLKENSSVEVSREMNKLLSKANAYRNLLAHKFLLEHAYKIKLAKQRGEVIQDLIKIARHFEKTGQPIKDLRNRLYAGGGFPEEQMREIGEKRMRELERNEDGEA
jgi:hypothetical protein